jgi:type IV pilus assembly protein PilE
MKTNRQMKTYKKKRSGFTVIELMIVIMIVSILVALAYPSYIQYVRKAKRGEAQQLLLNWAINQEIWRSNNIAYTDTLVPAHDDYTFVASNVGAATYTLTKRCSKGWHLVLTHSSDPGRNKNSSSLLGLGSGLTGPDFVHTAMSSTMP